LYLLGFVGGSIPLSGTKAIKKLSNLSSGGFCWANPGLTFSISKKKRINLDASTSQFPAD